MKTSRGFTLIELLVVIAIIALLASVVLGALSNARANARDAKRANDLRQLQNALELYRDTHGVYPATPSPSYVSLMTSGSSNILPFISVIPVDPTRTGGSGYRYQAAPDRRGYTLLIYPEGNTTYCKVEMGATSWSASYTACTF